MQPPQSVAISSIIDSAYVITSPRVNETVADHGALSENDITELKQKPAKTTPTF